MAVSGHKSLAEVERYVKPPNKSTWPRGLLQEQKFTHALIALTHRRKGVTVQEVTMQAMVQEVPSSSK